MNLLYRIYYDDYVAYLGRTRQPLNNRLRGHFIGRPMHKKTDVRAVTRIECAECKSVADMYLHEIFYINKLKPHLNDLDHAPDELTVTLPELDWRQHDCHLMDKWRSEMDRREADCTRARHEEEARQLRRRELRAARARGEISEEDYYSMIEEGGEAG